MQIIKKGYYKNSPAYMVYNENRTFIFSFPHSLKIYERERKKVSGFYEENLKDVDDRIINNIEQQIRNQFKKVKPVKPIEILN